MTIREDISDDVAEKGLILYNDRLKPILEPERNNQYVAIHVDTGDYAVARSWVSALQQILERHDPGRIFGIKVGSEPDYGLASRLVGSNRQAGLRK